MVQMRNVTALGLIGGLLVSGTPVQAGHLLDLALQRANDTRLAKVAMQPSQTSCAAAATDGSTEIGRAHV